MTREQVEKALQTSSRRSFAVAGLAALAGAGAWKWAGTEENLRANLERNASLTKGLVSDRRLAETYPDAMAQTPRSNGVIGLESDLDLDKWRVMVDDSKPWTLE